MRRNFETIRNMLIAIADKDLDDSNRLQHELGLEEDVLEYHLNLLCNDARLLTMDSRSMASSRAESNFKNIQLTWQGNDFLDAIGDERA